MGCPNLDHVLQSRSGQHWHRWMWFQAIDNARIIALHEVDNSLRVLVPKENMSTVAAADNVLRVGAKEVDALNGATISVNGKEG